MAEDPFPRERVSALLRRMPAYLKLSWRLAREPLLSKARRMAVVGAAGYLASPIDLVPGVVPVLGQLDDLAVALAAIRIALAGLSPEQRQRHLAAVGLDDDYLAEDLRTIAAATAWTVRATYRTTKRAAVAGGRAAMAGAGVAARNTRSAVDRATPAARSAVDRAGAVSPAAKAAAARAAPAAKATGLAARNMSARAAGAGGRAAGAAGAALGRIPRPGRTRPDPEILVTEVELPLLPPPPPGRARG